MSNTSLLSIAKQLGLSKATVSKALRDSYEISAITKERVIKLAEELNYVPNAYASSLRNQKSKTIAVVLPEVTDSFFSLAINGIENIAIQKGYHVLIYLTHENLEREKAILKDFKSGRIEGFLMSVSSQTNNGQHINDAINKGMPVVFFDRIFEGVKIPTVTTDDFESAYEATTHLIKKGCTKISFLYISSSLSISNNRIQGFKEALKNAGIKYSKNNLVECKTDSKQTIDIVNKILKSSSKPNGIIASVEKLTAPVYEICRQLSIKIPQHLKLISFTNLQTASLLNPSLTTIEQPAFEMGKQAAITLFQILEKKNSYNIHQNKIIKSQLIERDSTKK